MRATLFLFIDLLASLRWRALLWGALVVFLVALLAFGLTGALVVVGLDLQDRPRVTAVLRPGLAPREINRLYEVFREWAELRGASLPMQGWASGADEGAGRWHYTLALRGSSVLPDVLRRLESLPEVERIISRHSGTLRAVVMEPPWRRWLVVLALLSLFALAAAAVSAGARAATQDWQAQMEMLFYSGVTMGQLRLPFAGLSVLQGALGVLVAAVAAHAVRTWGSDQPVAAQQWVPYLLDPGLIWNLAALLGLTGLVVGLLCGWLGGLVVRRPL